MAKSNNFESWKLKKAFKMDYCLFHSACKYVIVAQIKSSAPQKLTALVTWFQ